MFIDFTERKGCGRDRDRYGFLPFVGAPTRGIKPATFWYSWPRFTLTFKGEFYEPK